MAKIPDDAIPVYLTKQEIVHLLVLLKISGYREKRDYPKSIRGSRNSEMQIIGRIMKRLRKSYERG